MGHCTEFLAESALGQSVSCSIGLIGRVLRLPENATHLLIVAQGTGVAPFLSILRRVASENI